jgi:integrase
MAFHHPCQRESLPNARSHDLRHTFVTNARRAKIDYFHIMAITGHKTLRVFQCYNLDLQEAMTTLQSHLTDHEMDTSMDTNASDAITSRRKNVMNPRG